VTLVKICGIRTLEEGRTALEAGANWLGFVFWPSKRAVTLSAGAELLVVGSRGRGGFTEMLLGSVSHAAVLHAVCPVVVVPSQPEDQAPGQLPS
jgi:nucleotide-binding universal stress UspA family protein